MELDGRDSNRAVVNGVSEKQRAAAAGGRYRQHVVSAAVGRRKEKRKPAASSGNRKVDGQSREAARPQARNPTRCARTGLLF